jgi:hypothetical protein
MKKNNLLNFFIIIFILALPIKSNAEIIILSSCDNKRDSFLKNEYILDLEKSIMIRNYIYNEKTYQKYRITDLTVKKKNKLERFIYKEENTILTEKLGYPQFYTQLMFEITNLNIMIKSVINNEESIKIMSICKKIERFEKES